MKVGILFPNTETSRFLAIKLLDSGYDVAFFCPESLDLDLALNIIYECNMVGQEQDSLRSATHKSFVVAKYDLSDCDVIGGLISFDFLLSVQIFFSYSMA